MSHEKVRQLVLEGRFPRAYRLDGAKKTSPYFIPLEDIVAFQKARRVKALGRRRR